MMDSLSAAKEKIKRLAGASSETGFMTITLSTSPLDNWRQFAPTFLNSEFNRVTKERELSKEQKRRLQADFDRVLQLLSYDVPSETQGLAVFADGQVFERVELPLRLVNRLVVEPWPYIRPLVHALSLVEPFVAVAVSRDDSSIYLLDEWGVSHEEDLTGPRLKTSDLQARDPSIKEYFAAARQGELVEHHFKEVGAHLGKLLDTSGARSIVVSAQHNIASNFRHSLPSALASHIVAEISSDANASSGRMLAAAREAMAKARHGQMEELAGRIKNALGAGGRGVAGFDEVAGAIQRQKEQALLVDRNYRVPGWRCSRCDWVGLVRPDGCPQCGGEAVAVADVVGELVRMVVLQNGQVEIGEDIPALDEMGGIAALLRYP
jgi:hypothetical protein